MYFTRTPFIARLLFPAVLWKVKTAKDEIFLTFDDGPDPEVTPWVLTELDKHKAKAGFFLRGDHAQKHPDWVKEISTRGHSIGSHSFSHPDAFKVKAEKYIDDVRRGNEAISDIIQKPVTLFRPPYGRLTRKTYHALKTELKIVMWSLMPGDFDENKRNEDVLNDCLRHSKPGSIIVLHDSQKAKKHLKPVLPILLEKFSGKFRMNKLE